MEEEKKIVSVYLNKDLLEQWEQIVTNLNKRPNLSKFVNDQLEWYVGLHLSTEKIECVTCGAVFSSKVWLKYTHNKDRCISCGSSTLRRIKYEGPQ